ncbi:hypothetical protein BDZ45DRAFT_79057 [Acephala macrosclerotiorum]|nr:hypothetical protein BDZ45DRAFT_79057 [Acephala macrosclerotiorum]
MILHIGFFFLPVMQTSTAWRIKVNLGPAIASRWRSIHDDIKIKFDEGVSVVTTSYWGLKTAVTATSGWDERSKWKYWKTFGLPSAAVTTSPQATSTQSPAAAVPSTTQSPSFVERGASRTLLWYTRWKLFHDDVQSEFDGGKTVVTATKTADDGRFTLTRTVTATSGWENNLMARIVTHDHLHAAAINSPRKASNGDLARLQISSISAQY